jgi:hypothetical protein
VNLLPVVLVPHGCQDLAQNVTRERLVRTRRHTHTQVRLEAADRAGLRDRCTICPERRRLEVLDNFIGRYKATGLLNKAPNHSRTHV